MRPLRGTGRRNGGAEAEICDSNTALGRYGRGLTGCHDGNPEVPCSLASGVDSYVVDGRAARQAAPLGYRQNSIHHVGGKMVLDGYSMYIPTIRLLQAMQAHTSPRKFTFLQVGAQLGSFAASVGVLGPLLHRD